MANTIAKLTVNGNYTITGQFNETTYNTNALANNKQFNGPMVNLVRSSNDMTLVGTTPASLTTPWYYGSTAPVFVNKTNETQDPFGGYNAFKVGGQANSTSNFYALNMDARSYFNSGNGSGGNNLYLKAGATYCYSLYAKAAEYGYVRFGPYDALPVGTNFPGIGSWEIEFNLITGVTATPYSYETAGMINVGNGWWRCWITRTIQDTSPTGNPGSFDIIPNPANSGNYIPDGHSGCYLFGVQVELGNYPSKYIATDLNGPLNSAVSKLDTTGNYYVSGTYDEFTKGMNLVQSGLYYYFDPSKPESWSGGTTINDLTGTNPPGIINGNFVYNYQNGGVLQLDGKTGYANTGISGNTAFLTPSGEFTMSVWFQFTRPSIVYDSPAVGSLGGSIFGSINFSGAGIYWYESPTSGGLPALVSVGMRVSTPYNQISAGTLNNPALNTWYNVVMVYSGANRSNILQMWLNGSLNQSTQALGGMGLSPFQNYDTGTYWVRMGFNQPIANGPAGYFPGQIGQCLIYNRALSASEIAQNFNEMRSQYGI